MIYRPTVWRQVSLLFCLASAFLLVGCVTQESSRHAAQSDHIDVVVINAARLSSQESAQTLKTLPAIPSASMGAASRSAQLLEVGILLFESKDVVEDPSLQEQGVFPLVRKAEARYLPYLLRQTLETSRQWGVVRVMPDDWAAAGLIIRGEIQISNGEQLQIHIQAHDSSERLWLNKVYLQSADAQAYEIPEVDPFQPLFDRLAQDLAEVKAGFSAVQLDELQHLAVLRYGQQLAPAAFADYLRRDEQGQYHVQRLPAYDDPMLVRIQKLQEYEYYFIDTVDEQYSHLFAEMQQTYQRWRQYSRELMIYMRDYNERQAGQSSGFRRGSLAAMNEIYGDYEWYRTQQKNLSELAAGFNTEILPTVLNLDDNVIQLDGNLQQQYQTWQNILQELLRLEQGSL